LIDFQQKQYPSVLGNTIFTSFWEITGRFSGVPYRNFTIKFRKNSIKKKEEIKMKTQLSKKNDSQQLTSALFVVSIILFAFIMALISNHAQSNLWYDSLKTQTTSTTLLNGIKPPNNQFIIPVNPKSEENSTKQTSMNLLIPINKVDMEVKTSQHLEKDKLVDRNKEAYLKLVNKKESIEDLENDNSNAELNVLLAQLNEYLLPETEPELDIEVLINPAEKEEKRQLLKNEYLEDLRKVKIKELDEYYAKQLIFKEYLVVDDESPLNMEEWMIDEKCWCFENKNTLASNEKSEEQ